MRFERVRDVLEYARACHHKLGEFCDRVAEETQKTRLSLLCDYMKRHESHMEQALSRYEADASEKVLDTWFQNAPRGHITEIFERYEISAETSIDDVFTLTMAVDNALIQLYRAMTESSEIPEVQAVFANLVSMEEHEKVLVARNTLLLDDF